MSCAQSALAAVGSISQMDPEATRSARTDKRLLSFNICFLSLKDRPAPGNMSNAGASGRLRCVRSARKDYRPQSGHENGSFVHGGKRAGVAAGGR
ncbi:hypothetical protein Pve01_36070 [Planomonospora venezuelensis]|nr:hypothetical protein Pve01_36070 [Planomonospora venezuelensis]